MLLLQNKRGTMTFAAIKPEEENPFKPSVETRGHVYDSLLDTIGATPLVRMSKFADKFGLEAEILAKLEFFNPLGTVKDRIGFSLIESAEREGLITPGKTTLIEPTSGNTGVALAFIAAMKGYRLILVMPESMSVERRKMFWFYGAELVLTPAAEGTGGAVKKAKELLDEVENAFAPGQFTNGANPKIHRETTAEEIWADTNGGADILVSGVGTGGTLTGVSQVLKKRKPGFKTYAVEPKDSPVLSGGQGGPHKIQGIGTGFVPDVLATDLIDDIIQVSNEETFEFSRELALLEGIPSGISTGAAFKAAHDVAKIPENKGKQIIVIVPSFAERYISTALFEGFE